MISFSSAAMFIASCTVNSGCKLSFCIIYADNLRNSLRFLAFELTIMFPVTPAVLKTVQMVMKFIRSPTLLSVHFHFSLFFFLFFFLRNFCPRLSFPSFQFFCFNEQIAQTHEFTLACDVKWTVIKHNGRLETPSV